MSQDRDLEHFSESLDEMFSRLGLPDPMVMAAVSSEWDELTGPPWAGRSRPLYIRGKTLVVEAASASMVAFLRYGVNDLVEGLDARFGKGVIENIDVKAPERP